MSTFPVPAVGVLNNPEVPATSRGVRPQTTRRINVRKSEIRANLITRNM